MGLGRGRDGFLTAERRFDNERYLQCSLPNFIWAARFPSEHCCPATAPFVGHRPCPYPSLLTIDADFKLSKKEFILRVLALAWLSFFLYPWLAIKEKSL
uniref:Uncharacterized protein n=1 Tax=Rhizophora mucronata TaxID=61149 RepID=A0A2P2JGM9_RHIMU